MQIKRIIHKNGILDIHFLEYVYIFVADVQIFVNPRCVGASGVKQLVQIPGMRYNGIDISIVAVYPFVTTGIGGYLGLKQLLLWSAILFSYI